MAKNMGALIGKPGQPGGHDLYAADEHAWIEVQISALKGGRLDLLDRDNLMEYFHRDDRQGPPRAEVPADDAFPSSSEDAATA